METKYLRPILTAKEPKNKNVLWCHDGKISYYDKEWKDVSGGGSSEITELSTSVLQNGLLQLAMSSYNLSSDIYITDNILHGNQLEFSTGAYIDINLSGNLYVVELQMSSSSIQNPQRKFSINSMHISDSSLYFSFPTASDSYLYNNLQGGTFMFANKISSFAEEENAYFIYVSSLSDGMTMKQMINFSACYKHPIQVSNIDPSRWTLTDIQNILSNLASAGGYFRVSSQA